MLGWCYASEEVCSTRGWCVVFTIQIVAEVPSSLLPLIS